MKRTDNHDLVLSELLNKLDKEQAPKELKSEILLSIEGVTMTNSKLSSPFAPKIWIPVSVIVIFCLGWTLSQVEWSGWNSPDLSWLALPKMNWQPHLSINSLSEKLSNLSFPTGKWIYYTGAGIVMTWLFLLINAGLNKLTRTRQAFSE